MKLYYDKCYVDDIVGDCDSDCKSKCLDGNESESESDVDKVIL